MPNANGPCVSALPAVLFVEPGLVGYSERAAQLEKSDYRVVRAEDASDLFAMCAVSVFSVAVLSDLAGFFPMRAAAQVVRRQWPKARILILGKAPAEFEDQLYDEAVTHASSETALLAKVHRLAEEYWARRGETFGDWVNSVSRVARPVAAWPVSESDPTKAPATLFLTENTRSWAGSARRLNGSR